MMGCLGIFKHFSKLFQIFCSVAVVWYEHPQVLEVLVPHEDLQNLEVLVYPPQGDG